MQSTYPGKLRSTKPLTQMSLKKTPISSDTKRSQLNYSDINFPNEIYKYFYTRMTEWLIFTWELDLVLLGQSQISFVSQVSDELPFDKHKKDNQKMLFYNRKGSSQQLLFFIKITERSATTMKFFSKSAQRKKNAVCCKTARLE